MRVLFIILSEKWGDGDGFMITNFISRESIITAKFLTEMQKDLTRKWAWAY